jgi:hypothetical protein
MCLHTKTNKQNKTKQKKTKKTNVHVRGETTKTKKSKTITKHNTKSLTIP